MKHIVIPFLLLIPAMSVRAAVVISEVLYNEVGSNTAGEWLEIFNTGGASVDLTNWKIGDEETSGGTGTTEAMFSFPAGSAIAGGDVLVIAVNADQFFNVYGFLPDFELAGGPSNHAAVPDLSVYAAWDPDGGLINMSNTNDQALLLDSLDLVVDALSWGNTFAFDPALDPNAEADGQSYARIDPYTDTDTAADWALTPGGTNAATPGSVVPEPSVLLLAGLGGIAFLRRRRP